MSTNSVAKDRCSAGAISYSRWLMEDDVLQ